MYTQDDLREALRHSAARADDLPDVDLAATREGAGRSPARTSRPRRRGLVMALATAASVAAVIAGTTGLRAWLDDARQAAPTADPAASTDAPAPSGSPTAHADPRVAVNTAALIDAVDIAPDSRMAASYSLAVVPGVEEVRQPTGPGPNDPALTIDVASPASGLDPARIPRDNPVSIAGTTGYYSKLAIFPIDGSTGPGSDKWLPAWTIAFPQGENWVFVWLQTSVNTAAMTNSVNDPERIAQVYEQYGVTFGQPAGRLPFRLGWLPNGLAVVGVSFQRQAGTGDIAVNGTIIELSATGDRYIALIIEHEPPTPAVLCTSAPADSADAPSPAGCGPAPQYRDLGDADGSKLVIQSSPVYVFDAATLQRVLDTITLADLNNPASFYSVAEALG